MSATYERGDATVMKLLAQELKRRHHKALAEADPAVAVLMASDPEGHAVWLHGYAAAATVKISTYKERCLGQADATITIDARTWEDLDTKQRVALLDHELTHLLPVKGDDGRVKTDAAGRPRFKMRPHDWELGGFADVSKRHGEDALEMQAIRHTQHRYAQLIFGFAMDDARTLAAAAAILGTARKQKGKGDAEQDDAQQTSAPPDATSPASEEEQQKLPLEPAAGAA